MTIGGFLKTSLLDYPGHIASTVFICGCNYRCPYCHNADLVAGKNLTKIYTQAEIIDYLKKRSGIIEGICFTGGEPTLCKDLFSFISDVKNMGFLVKLDTNGCNPMFIKNAYERKLIDYVAMDIKNSKEKYAPTCGVPIHLSNLERSIDYVRSCGIDYEFRTTVIKEYHTPEDIESIGQWLNKSSQYYLQQYVEQPTQFKTGLHPHSEETLKAMADSVKDCFDHVGLRGI